MIFMMLLLVTKIGILLYAFMVATEGNGHLSCHQYTLYISISSSNEEMYNFDMKLQGQLDGLEFDTWNMYYICTCKCM